MPGKQTAYGKAFEYACLQSLRDVLSKGQEVQVEETPQLLTAKKKFTGMPEDAQKKLLQAATAATDILLSLEPRLEYPGGDEPLYLSLQADSRGMKGDVRDVLCVRKQNKWEIGISCKHNHRAVKHSRLSDTIDFGAEWLGFPCSQQYFDEVVPLFSELRKMRDDARNNGEKALWADIPDKADRYYVPILRSFLGELNRLAEEHPETPARLVQYLLGREDFYKVITDDRNKTTRVEAVNINGKLNIASGEHKPITKTPRLHLPARFYHMDFKPGSKTTVEVVCDGGWTLTMRLHNASSRVEPSLKFDIQLVSLPESIHAQVQPWGRIDAHEGSC